MQPPLHRVLLRLELFVVPIGGRDARGGFRAGDDRLEIRRRKPVEGAIPLETADLVHAVGEPDEHVGRPARVPWRRGLEVRAARGHEDLTDGQILHRRAVEERLVGAHLEDEPLGLVVILFREDLDLGGPDLILREALIDEVVAVGARRVQIHHRIGGEQPFLKHRARVGLHRAHEEEPHVALGVHHLRHARANVDGLDRLLHAHPRREGHPVAVLEEGRDRVRHHPLGLGGAGFHEHLRVDQRGDLLLPRLVRTVGRLRDDARPARHHDVVETRVRAQLGHLQEREMHVRARIAAGPGAIGVPAAVFRVAVQARRHPSCPVTVLHYLIEPSQDRIDHGVCGDFQSPFWSARECRCRDHPIRRVIHRNDAHRPSAASRRRCCSLIILQFAQSTW